MWIKVHYALHPFVVQTDLIKAIYPSDTGSVIYFVGDENGIKVDETTEAIIAMAEGVW